MTQIDTQALRLAMQRTLPHKLSDYVVDNLLADRLLDRCDLFRHEPASILNIGSRHGYVTQSLMNSYPAATVQSVEMFHAWEALFKKRLMDQNVSWVSSYDDLSADAHTYDFIFSSLALSMTSHWLDCFQAWQRVLKPDGVLLFSCLGVDTLCELKQAFLTAGQEVPVYSQPDMHDVGDALLAARYVDPVMHRDVITLHYRTLDQLFYDLRVMGATYFDEQRSKTCRGKSKWKQVLSYYDELRDDQGRYPVTIEILYGQAIAPDLAHRSTSNGNEVTVSVDDIIKPLS